MLLNLTNCPRDVTYYVHEMSATLLEKKPKQKRLEIWIKVLVMLLQLYPSRISYKTWLCSKCANCKVFHNRVKLFMKLHLNFYPLTIPRYSIYKNSSKQISKQFPVYVNNKKLCLVRKSKSNKIRKKLVDSAFEINGRHLMNESKQV